MHPMTEEASGMVSAPIFDTFLLDSVGLNIALVLSLLGI